MTRSKWLEKVNDNAAVLRRFISEWHPSVRESEADMPITAPAAEQACQRIRMEIKQKESGDPLKRWDAAVSSGDITEINTLLNDAWFGVPESTACWGIPGFDLACDLMGDVPEED